MRFPFVRFRAANPSHRPRRGEIHLFFDVVANAFKFRNAEGVDSEVGSANDPVPLPHLGGNPNGQSATADSAVIDLAQIGVAGNFTAGDEIAIGSNTYTFVASSPTGNQVLIGADFDESVDNLIAVVDADGVVTGEVGPGVGEATFTVVDFNGEETYIQLSTSTAEPSSWNIPFVSAGFAAVEASFIGQFCKSATAWWQWDGTAWIPRQTLTGQQITRNDAGSAYYILGVDGDGAPTTLEFN